MLMTLSVYVFFPSFAFHSPSTSLFSHERFQRRAPLLSNERRSSTSLNFDLASSSEGSDALSEPAIPFRGSGSGLVRASPSPEVSLPGGTDVVSRLLDQRILLLGTQVTDEVANALVGQLLYLANQDPEKDIKLFINSPGGSVTAGMAIFDTMMFVPCDIETVCFGTAASMGSFLLAAGTKGKRKSLPNAKVMIHQPLGGAQGAAADIEIQAKELLHTRERLNRLLSFMTGQDLAKVRSDTDRDFWMTAEEARDYGLVDEVVETKTSKLIQIPPLPTLA